MLQQLCPDHLKKTVDMLQQFHSSFHFRRNEYVNHGVVDAAWRQLETLQQATLKEIEMGPVPIRYLKTREALVAEMPVKGLGRVFGKRHVRCFDG